MMQRCLTRLRSLAVGHSRLPLPPPSSRRLLHHHAPPPQQPLHSHFSKTNRSFLPPFIFSSSPLLASRRSPLPPSLGCQVRHVVSSRDRKKKRKAMNPVVSKLKKYKIKSYSSFKSRFRPLNDGTIRRWKEGKRHNAHLKSKISKRRLRQPGIVPAAYAKVMKKLGFCG